VEPGGRCADANKSRVGERRADHDGQSSGAMTTGLAASSVTAATYAPALRSSATVLWPVAWKFGDNQGRMCGMSVTRLGLLSLPIVFRDQSAWFFSVISVSLW
jgi:hypothetical protein